MRFINRHATRLITIVGHLAPTENQPELCGSVLPLSIPSEPGLSINLSVLGFPSYASHMWQLSLPRASAPVSKAYAICPLSGMPSCLHGMPSCLHIPVVTSTHTGKGYFSQLLYQHTHIHLSSQGLYEVLLSPSFLLTWKA